MYLTVLFSIFKGIFLTLGQKLVGSSNLYLKLISVSCPLLYPPNHCTEFYNNQQGSLITLSPFLQHSVQSSKPTYTLTVFTYINIPRNRGVSMAQSGEDSSKHVSGS